MLANIFMHHQHVVEIRKQHNIVGRLYELRVASYALIF